MFIINDKEVIIPLQNEKIAFLEVKLKYNCINNKSFMIEMELNQLHNTLHEMSQIGKSTDNEIIKKKFEKYVQG